MADEPTTTPAAPAAPAEPETPADRTVPYERFTEVNERAKKAESSLKEMSDRMSELEDRDKSEVERHRAQLEREQKERERLSAELAQRDERLTRVERGQWVRAAAQEAKFIDPEDAVVNVDLSGVESEKDAERAVKKLAERKKHLVQQEQKTPAIGRVLKDGEPADPNAEVDQQAADREEGEKFVGELREALQRGKTSIPGLLDR